MSCAKKYQNAAFNVLKNTFGDQNVKKEWDVAKNSQDDFNRTMYCPRPDLAVGPFNIDQNIVPNLNAISQTLNMHRNLIQKLIAESENYSGNVLDFLEKRNKNPRCMLAIEVEHSGSRKHMLGDIANASILGAIGIVIPLSTDKLNSFKKIMNYVDFATIVGKIKPIFNNVLIIKKATFLRVIRVNKKDVAHGDR